MAPRTDSTTRDRSFILNTPAGTSACVLRFGRAIRSAQNSVTNLCAPCFGRLVPYALNRAISTVEFLATVASDLPFWSVTRKVVSPASMVSLAGMAEANLWMRWSATCVPPLLDTRRWMTSQGWL